MAPTPAPHRRARAEVRADFETDHFPSQRVEKQGQTKQALAATGAAFTHRDCRRGAPAREKCAALASREPRRGTPPHRRRVALRKGEGCRPVATLQIAATPAWSATTTRSPPGKKRTSTTRAGARRRTRASTKPASRRETECRPLAEATSRGGGIARETAPRQEKATLSKSHRVGKHHTHDPLPPLRVAHPPAGLPRHPSPTGDILRLNSPSENDDGHE